MNKLLVALFAGAFAFGSVSALADDFDTKPLSKMDAVEAEAAKADAATHWAKMTLGQQAAALKAAMAKKHADLTALDRIALDKAPQGSEAYGLKHPLFIHPLVRPTRQERWKPTPMEGQKDTTWKPTPTEGQETDTTKDNK